MFTLVIADDERPIREGLASVDWAALGFAVAGVVSNGAKALELVEAGGVDAVLVDIRMPVMTGLQLANRLHESHPEVQVVLLTGYSDFEYARSAILSGVFRYLVKPIDIRELMETFRELRERLEQRRRAGEEVQELRASNSALLELGIQSVLHRIITGELMDLERIEERLAAVEVAVGGREVRCCLCDAPVDSRTQLVRAVGAQSAERGLEVSCHGLQVGECGVVVILSSDVGDDVLLGLLEDCRPAGAVVFVSVGKEHPVFLGALYAQVLATRGVYKGAPGVVPAVDTGRTPMLGYPYTLEKRLTDAVLYGEPEAVESTAMEFTDALRRRYEGDNPGFVAEAVGVYLAALASRMEDLGLPADSLVPVAGMVRGAPCLSTEMAWLLARALAAACRDARASFEALESRGSFPVEEVRGYIRECSCGKLTLEQVAKRFGFAPSYVSACFKRLTGTNFTEYVRECRLEQAKALLTGTNLKIYQIAAEVGYENNQYFNDMFKEHVGCTPQKYRVYKRNRH